MRRGGASAAPLRAPGQVSITVYLNDSGRAETDINDLRCDVAREGCGCLAGGAPEAGDGDAVLSDDDNVAIEDSMQRGKVRAVVEAVQRSPWESLAALQRVDWDVNRACGYLIDGGDGDGEAGGRVESGDSASEGDNCVDARPVRRKGRKRRRAPSPSPSSKRQLDAVAVRCFGVGAADAEVSVVLRRLSESPPKVPRPRHTHMQREQVREVYRSLEDAKGRHRGVRSGARPVAEYFRTRPGTEHITPRTVAMIVQGSPSKSGRRINASFECDVLGQLMFEVVRNGTGERDEVIRQWVNLVYSYSMVREAARIVRDTSYKDNAEVSSMKFSDHWVHGFLERHNLRRLRCTTGAAKAPDPASVRDRLLQIKSELEGVPLWAVFNIDETAVMYSPQPVYQYVRPGVKRGAALPDDKRRVTAILGTSAEGELLPFFLILVTTAGADQSYTTTLESLKNSSSHFSDWTVRTWRGEVVTARANGERQVARHVRKYITNGKDVVTLQKNAWCDTAAMMMYIDLIFGGAVRSEARFSGQRLMLVWYNCGSHKTAAVMAVLDKHGIDSLPLPPNTTSWSQPMDTCVNGPLKADMRRRRLKAVYEYSLDWRARVERASAAGVAAPKYQPPPWTHSNVVAAVSKSWSAAVSTRRYASCLQNAFWKIGVVQKDGAYVDMDEVVRAGFGSHDETCPVVDAVAGFSLESSCGVYDSVAGCDDGESE